MKVSPGWINSPAASSLAMEQIFDRAAKCRGNRTERVAGLHDVFKIGGSCA